MKRAGAFCFVFIFLFGILSHFVSADLTTLDDKMSDIEDKIDNAENIIQSPEKDKIASDYLKKEWGKILETKPIIGEIIRQYKKVSPKTDPFVEFFVGLVPSISWLFVLTFIIWLTFIRYSIILSDYLSEFGLIVATKTLIYLAVMTVILVLQILQTLSVWIANRLIELASLAQKWWVQLILMTVIFVLIVISNFGRKALRVYLRALRMKKYQDKIKNAAEYVDKEKKQKVKEEQLELGLQ